MLCLIPGPMSQIQGSGQRLSVEKSHQLPHTLAKAAADRISSLFTRRSKGMSWSTKLVTGILIVVGAALAGGAQWAQVSGDKITWNITIDRRGNITSCCATLQPILNDLVGGF